MRYPWGGHRRFNAYSSFIREQLGERALKIAIDAGFSCPNRDGACGTTGCTFCSNNAFNPSYCTPQKSVSQQIEDGIRFHQKRGRGTSLYLAYFQAFSNTYAVLDRLRVLYESALLHPSICGLVIATRPDCLSDEVLDYLAELGMRTHLFLEIGVETLCDRTLARIHRGHSAACALDAIRRAGARGIHIGVHLMFGLPGENKAQWLIDRQQINQLPIRSIKFHQLQIIKGTMMEQDYLEHPSEFHLLTLQEYIDFIADYLSGLSPHILIERFISEVPSRYLAIQHWGGITYDQFLQNLEKRMEEKDCWQGKFYQPEFYVHLQTENKTTNNI